MENPNYLIERKRRKLRLEQYLNQIQSSGAGSDAPHGGGFDVSGLNTKF